MPKEYVAHYNITDLKKQINYIIAKTEIDNAIKNKDVDAHIQRISKNFYSEIGQTLAFECLQLYRNTKNRESVCSFLLIAYDIEQNWLAYNKEKIIIERITNPDSYDRFDFYDIALLSVEQEREMKRKLRRMLYKDYLRSPYWRAVRNEVLRLNGRKCLKCDLTHNLNVHHMDYAYVGEDHKHMDNLVVFCEQHHLEWHMLHD